MNDKLADAPHIWKPPFRWDDFDGVCRDADNWAVPVRELTELLIVALRRSQPEGMVINHNSFECARWPKCGCKSGADVNQCVGLRQALSAAEAEGRKG